MMKTVDLNGAYPLFDKGVDHVMGSERSQPPGSNDGEGFIGI